MTAETKRSFLRRCDLLARELAGLRADLSVQRVREIDERGAELGRALCRLQVVIQSVTPVAASQPTGGANFTAPMVPKFRGD